MNDFIGSKNIISDEPMINENTLGVRNDLMKNPFEPISQHICNDFIYHIAETNMSEISNFKRMLCFGNESYEGMINGS